MATEMNDADAKVDAYREAALALRQVVEDLRASNERLRGTLREARDELARWGWGDMHYGSRPQERSVTDVLTKIDKALEV